MLAFSITSTFSYPANQPSLISDITNCATQWMMQTPDEIQADNFKLAKMLTSGPNSGVQVGGQRKPNTKITSTQTVENIQILTVLL